MADRVWIAGAGMTPFGKHPDLSGPDLGRWAVRDALADVGEASTDDIEAVFSGTVTAGALHGQFTIPGEIAVRELGIQSVPVYNVENACATGSTALNLAATAIAAGSVDVALAVGFEKMNIGDRAREMALFESGYDVSDPDALARNLEELGGAIDDSDIGTRSVFMDIYAAWARNHMRLFGTTQGQIAAAAAKNHAHAVENERAYYRRAMTVEEILAARRLAYPLTVPMCAPTTDGGSAVILCSDEGLRKVKARRPVEVLASVIGTGSDRDLSTFRGHLAGRAARRAYERAGIAPSDIDVAEVHDATAFGEILQSEQLGLVPEGEGGAAALAGETTIGGRIPINPSGGLESKGHPLGATGIAQVFELVQQLRGASGARQVEAARFAIAENGGGFHGGEEAVASIIILGASVR